MQIRKHIAGPKVEIHVEGRLDANWASHLESYLNETIRQGARHVLLNLGRLKYISSAGIRVLLTTFKQLKSAKGSFVLSQPSPAVKSVIDMVGLDSLFHDSRESQDQTGSLPQPVRTFDRLPGSFRVYRNPSSTKSAQSWHLVGSPHLLHSGGYTGSECRAIHFPVDVLGLGLGAFGNGYEDCIPRFGEFLAVAGHVVCQSVDSPDTPDFMIGESSFIPEAQVLYMMAGTGDFPFFMEFQGQEEGMDIPLSAIGDVAMEVCGADAVSFACLGEVSGLVGYGYRRSPVLAAHPDEIFSYPSILDWIHYRSEPACQGAITLAVGIASRRVDMLASFTRPLDRDKSILGHVHAAVFPYRPLAGGYQELRECLEVLFQGQEPIGLIHLLSDLQRINGAGESKLARGICWTSPIELTEETSR
ncbi:MAG: STAS domain-containing protein [Deltaproteobacteria bacterium]|nr:STAS domain-containing protein [Deltaproteobacteria bacterium]MBF0509309.1 STAS domain-containing protein [Deltaproteobacteria bacterium]MBF0526113.1 STAS domain-containing protein [Deltaproteobacteria bacterium]